MRAWRGLSVVGALVVGACGDEGSKGRDSAIDGKSVSELSSNEQKTLCEWFVKVHREAKLSDQQLCTQQGAESAGGHTDTCEENREICLDWPEEFKRDDCETFEVNEACTAEVRVLKECASAAFEAYADSARSASCEDPDAALEWEEPASCEDLSSDCRELNVEVARLAL